MSSVLARLKSVPVLPSIWDKLPYSRRAGVLVMLFQNKYGDVSPILTLRSHDLSSFSGHAALPGGKADHDYETAYQVARREAYEEIGFDQDDDLLRSKGIEVQYLTSLPAYLSRNLLAVKPSIISVTGEGFHLDPATGVPSFLNLSIEEVKEAFSVPLSRFLSNQKGWYTGKQVNWGGLAWNQHHFQTIRHTKSVGETGWLNVWGLTANILVDTARLAYGREPPMDHRKEDQFGDEEVLKALWEKGLLPEVIDKKKDVDINFAHVFGKDSPLLDTRKTV